MIAYKSKIFISKDQKTDINQKIFIINQLYNFMISKMLEEDFQYDLCEQNFGKFIPFDDSTKFVISKKSKVRNVLNEDFKKYMELRKISIKGFSKPIQLKIEQFLDIFNKIHLSPIKFHNFKITSELLPGSYQTDSAIKLRKVKATKNKKKYTKFFIKIGKEEYELKNRKLNIKNFKLKRVYISRKNNQYYISISGEKSTPKHKINTMIGIDTNYDNIALSNGILEPLNYINTYNIVFSEKMWELERQKSKMEEEAKNILLKENISVYNGKHFTKEAKSLYREILSSNKQYIKTRKLINNLHQKRINVQDDVFKKIAKKITDKNDLVFIEDLKVLKMVNKNVSNKHLYKASMSKFLTTLINKAHTTGKIIIKVNPAYTSQDCSNIKCSYRKKDLKKEDREWICPICLSKHHRDINAAKNVYIKGINTLGEEYNHLISA